MYIGRNCRQHVFPLKIEIHCSRVQSDTREAEIL